MQIIYVCSGCSTKKYFEYVESRGQRVQQQSQKYNRLLMEGLASCDADVITVSTRPINRTLTRQVYFKGEQDSENGIHYHYVPFFNLPVLRNISIFINVLFKILLWKKRDDTVILCDGLNVSASAAVVVGAKLRGIKTVGIVTDVPCHRPNNQKIPVHERINLWLMRQFDMYLLLTQQMNEIVNHRKRPYVVMEGHVDVSMNKRENQLVNKFPTRVCLYAGSLRRVYGIENLVQGFVKANIPNTELHIYGNGNYEMELCELTRQYKNVKYLGIAPNEIIIQEELKATLLINPRPTNEEYTKYSFPSKNMEYMASGTPVLTTCLPGMPKEYNDYVFLLQDESVEGIKNALADIFGLSAQELHEKGMAARTFVLKNKNNVVQAQKVLNLITKEG